METNTLTAKQCCYLVSYIMRLRLLELYGLNYGYSQSVYLRHLKVDLFNNF